MARACVRAELATFERAWQNTRAKSRREQPSHANKLTKTRAVEHFKSFLHPWECIGTLGGGFSHLHTIHF